ncbi:MAG: TolC family protein [Clostridium sp.]|nr:TolC family protein [Clostridium sp.]
MRNSEWNVRRVKDVRKVLAVILCLTFAAVFPVESRGEESQTLQSIEYDNLRELLKAGNLSLKKEYEDNEDNIAAYQEMWDIMKREQGNLEDKAEEALESGDENSSLYSSNAISLKNSASRIYKQLENMTSAKSLRSLEKSADSSLLTAQTLMNSYQQMAWNVEAGQKNVEALTAVYSEALRKQAAGTATAADVAAAKSRLDRESNSLESLREQAASLKRQLLTMVGLSVDSGVAIGSIPEPDLAAIDSIDFEADRVKAVNNSSAVINTRHTQASGTGAWNRRAKAVDEAEGTAEASIAAAYQDLAARRAEYEAACWAYESALMTYQSLQRRQQAGLLSNTDYLQGEADYLESRASRETASMNLVQAYESYCWEVKGVS